MYAEQLKQYIGGLAGSFIMKDRELMQSDLKSDQQRGIRNIPYLVEAINEKRDLKKLIFFCDKKNLSIHFYQDLIVGLVVTPATNVFLLDFLLKRVLENLEQLDVPRKSLSTIEEQVPYFDRPKEEVIPNVPEYARHVLKFVDGRRTVRDIIADSDLPREIVLEIITAYRRSSVVHYKAELT